MAKICDNTSVGQIIQQGHRVVLIERRNYPRAYALPAGHVDGDNPWSAGVEREVREEIGLDIKENIELFRREIDNPCKREGGSRHLWKVYRAVSWSGELKAGSDAKRAFWADPGQLRRFVERTDSFIKKYGIAYERVGDLTRAIFGKDPAGAETDPEWREEMGLEPVWYFILKELRMI